MKVKPDTLSIDFFSDINNCTLGYFNNSEVNRLYQAYYGLMVCPWYAYSQTMISEVSPLSQMYFLSISFTLEVIADAII